jgi:hypothetical protein
MFPIAFMGGSGTAPQASPFHVHAHKIALGVQFGQAYGVFTAPAGQFQRNGVNIPKKIGPMAFQRERILANLLKCGLKNMLKTGIFSKPL